MNTCDETELKLKKMQECIRASHILGLSLDLKETLTRVMRSAESVMESEASSIMLLDKDGAYLTPTFLTTDTSKAAAEQDHITAVMSSMKIPVGKGIAGCAAKTGESILVSDAYNDPRFNPEADKQTGFRTRSILCAPLMVQGKLIGVAEVLNKKNGTYDDLDKEIFELYATRAAVSIHTAQLHAEIVEKKKIEQQMETARRIQASLQGPGEFERGGVCYAARSESAFFVGGDFHDLRELADGRVAFLFGDVSGKGMPAALMMSQIITVFRALSPLMPDPGSLLTSLNNELVRSATMGMFATCFCGLLDPEKDTLTYANAGHPAPLMWDGIRFAYLSSIKQNIPVGIMPSQGYEREEVKIGRNRLIFYTDGVTEAKNRAGEEFGEGRLEQFVEEEEKKETGAAGEREGVDEGENVNTCERFVERLIKHVREFENGLPAHDDTTAAILRLR